MKTRKMLISFFAVLIFQFAVYYLTKFINAPMAKYDFTTSFDRMIPFIPGFVYIYIGAYVFWILSAFYVAKKTSEKNYYNLITSLFISYIVCALFFIFLPTTIIRPDVDTSDLSGYLTAWIFNADTPVNLFPSMHCLISWFCFTATRSQKDLPKGIKIFIFIFAVLVCISTQTLKQHYIVDLVSAIALSEAVWFLVCRFNLGKICEKMAGHTKL